MKVKAKHWLNYNGVWHKGGDEFEIPDGDLEQVAEYVEAGEYVSAIFPPEEPKKRVGRPRKKET